MTVQSQTEKSLWCQLMWTSKYKWLQCLFTLQELESSVTLLPRSVSGQLSVGTPAFPSGVHTLRSQSSQRNGCHFESSSSYPAECTLCFSLGDICVCFLKLTHYSWHKYVISSLQLGIFCLLSGDISIPLKCHSLYGRNGFLWIIQA